MFKLVITELAQEDLEGIVEYIAIDLANTTAASEFLSKVQECYGYLKKNPYIYAPVEDRRLAKEGYRKALIKNYILVFKVDEKNKSTTIYRFFYAARDYFKYL